MIVTLILVRDVIVAQWHKQEIKSVRIVLLVCINLKVNKGHVDPVNRVHGVIQLEVHRH